MSGSRERSAFSSVLTVDRVKEIASVVKVQEHGGLGEDAQCYLAMLEFVTI